MYVPDYYKPDDEQVSELLRHHGAVDLVTTTPDGLRATMLPMIWVEPSATEPAATALGLLRGHFARKNDHWKQPVMGEAMAIVRGPDAYITPTWYETKREHGRVVPTWNYITAHVYGELAIFDDPAWVAENVHQLVAKHEAGRDPAWAVDDAPAVYIEGQLKAIVGVEVRISRIEAKCKLSQNRSTGDVRGAIEGLAAENRADMAAVMEVAQAAQDRD